MTRNRNKFGIGVAVVLAALVASIVVLSGAQAEETNNPHFTSFNTTSKKHEQTKYYGTSEATGGVTKILGGRTIECHHAEFEAASATGLDEKLELKNIKYYGEEGKTLSATCQTAANHVVDVEMNGCTYMLNLKTTLTASMDIICPKGNEIIIKLTNPAKLTEIKCTMKIPPQTGLNHVLFASASPTSLTVEFKVQGFSYELEGDPTSCVAPIGKVLKNGELESNMLLTGFDSTGTVAMDVSTANVATK
jgi:hypothetical protein